MDGRVLLNLSPGKSSRDVAELADWSPGPTLFPAGGAVDALEPVSVILPTFFNAELKRRSLRFVLAGLNQSQAIREIILVSSDGELQDFTDLQAAAGHRPIRVIESDPHNRGKSRNAGAAAATSPNLLFLDDDMLLRNWRCVDVILSKLLTSGQQAALFPRRHYARFPLLFDPGTLQQVIDLWRTQGTADGSPFLYDPRFAGARDLPMLFCFPGCFMLIRRSAYEELNGFTEDFVGWGFEDTEFGVRAMNQLRVLNLFRTGEPLLHIDHPVSPYKSEEHNANYQKFYDGPERPDMNLFCRRVFLGTNFAPGRPLERPDDAWLDPLQRLAQRAIPLRTELASAWWLRIARQRVRQHLSPLPKFIVLHGSRAEGRNGPNDDYDILGLYDGAVQEYYATDGLARVELECADFRRFEHIALHPAIHSFTGPMELAKLAGARLLWGHSTEWNPWSHDVLQGAMERGWCFWLVLGLGLRRHFAKYGPMATRYFRSLEKLRAQAIAFARFQVNGEGDFSDETTLAIAAAHALDKFRPGWRHMVRATQPVFELQVPELWTALHCLECMKVPTNKLASRPRRAGPSARPRLPRTLARR